MNITSYREMLMDMLAAIRRDYWTEGIKGPLLAVDERHLVKKLKDCPGTVLCGNYPDMIGRGATEDEYKEVNSGVLFLLEKTDEGGLTDDEEIKFFSEKEDIMADIKSYLLNHAEYNSGCYKFELLDNQLVTEWEYNIYGGFSGLSLSFKFKIA